MQRILRPLLALFLMLLPSLVLAEVPIPRLSQAVMDEAKIVNGHVKSYLNMELLRLHQSGGSQIAVLTVPSLEGEDIAAFSIRAADAWKLGSESKDNGVLLVIAVKERKLRIEVGQGNEGVLTDLQASRIIDTQITPYFKQGDFDSGVKVGVLAIAALTNPEFVFQSSESVPTVKRNKAGGLSPIVFFILLIVIIILSNKGGRGGSDGLVGFLAGFVLGGGLGGRSGGGFGGSDGGGFSGGGGGFSGGGASGEW